MTTPDKLTIEVLKNRLADTMRSLAVRDSEVDHLDGEVERLMRELEETNKSWGEQVEGLDDAIAELESENEGLRNALLEIRFYATLGGGEAMIAKNVARCSKICKQALEQRNKES